jgi:hypothetical protein
MIKLKVVSMCIALFLMFSFILVGYAALTDTMTMLGTAEVNTPEGLFIVKIEQGTRTGLDVYNASFAEYSTTVTSNLSKSSDRTAGSITYTITVLNNTKHQYAYRGLYYQDSVNSNKYISQQSKAPTNKINIVTDFFQGTIVEPGHYLQFRVTYTLGSDRNTFRARDTFTTLVNYQFGINVATEEAARDAIVQKFANILNTVTTYNQLVDVLDNKYDGYNEWTSNYVGNVGDADTDDAMAVNTLFAGQLQMIINGQVKPATVLIKHENLDNNSKTGDDYVAVNKNNSGSPFRGYGCEMTLYLTTDPLTTSYGNAEVYVCVFTCDRDEAGNIVSQWYRIGDTYKGLAPIVGYNGGQGGTGSFVTDNWVSSYGNYSPSTNYTYSVGAQETLKSLTQIYDPQAVVAFQKLLDDAKAMIDDLRYAGIGITIVEDAYDRASKYFTLNASGKPIADQDTLRVWLCPVMEELSEALRRAQEEIDNIEGKN